MQPNGLRSRSIPKGDLPVGVSGALLGVLFVIHYSLLCLIFALEVLNDVQQMNRENPIIV